jgi:hypothetical protein
VAKLHQFCQEEPLDGSRGKVAKINGRCKLFSTFSQGISKETISIMALNNQGDFDGLQMV